MESFKYDIVIKQEKDICPSNEEFVQYQSQRTRIKQEPLDNNEAMEHSTLDLKHFTTYEVECEFEVKQEPNTSYIGNIETNKSIYQNAMRNHKIQPSKVESDRSSDKYFRGECDYCNKLYGCRLSLVKHIEKHIVQQTCRACVLFFRTQPEFIAHVRSVHNVHPMFSDVDRARMSTPFVCDICDRRFTQSINLKYHRRLHTNERPHVCDVCNKSFTRKSYLESHQRTHVDVRPHVCHLCNKSFALNRTLERHKRTHTNERPYVCDVCNKSFSLDCNFKRHRRTHTNERPYICPYCEKCFTQNSNLKTHLRTHTNERPFVCDVCNKSFSLGSNFKRHQRTHNHTNICPI